MLTLYHSPKTRSSRILWLLEELGADYEVAYVDVSRQDGSGGPDARNPHPDKKVPALAHDGALITESMAIVLYLCDLYPHADASRPVGAPGRGELLTWLFYYSGVVEPTIHFDMLGLSDVEGLRRTFRGKAERDARIMARLAHAPYLVDERFSAADLVFTSVGQFMRETLPPGPVIDAYLQRCMARPAFQRAISKDNPQS